MSKATCCICHLDLFTTTDLETDWADALHCGHVIHHLCFERIQNRLCPYCREPMGQPIKLYINFETNEEMNEAASQAVPTFQTIRTRLDDAIAILRDQTNALHFIQDISSSIPLPTPRPTQPQGLAQGPSQPTPRPTQRNNDAIFSTTQPSRDEHIVHIPLPWENVRGQMRILFEVVNNQIQIRMSRRRR